MNHLVCDQRPTLGEGPRGFGKVQTLLLIEEGEWKPFLEGEQHRGLYYTPQAWAWWGKAIGPCQAFGLSCR